MYSKFYYMVWTGLHNLGNGNLSLSNSFLTFLIMKFLISKMFPNSKFAIYFFSQYRYRDRFSSSVERFLLFSLQLRQTLSASHQTGSFQVLNMRWGRDKRIVLWIDHWWKCLPAMMRSMQTEPYVPSHPQNLVNILINNYCIYSKN